MPVAIDDPLAYLRRDQEQLRTHAGTLQAALEAHHSGTALSPELLQALNQARAYFSGPGALHHQDEEQDLFALLARQSLKIAEGIHRLRQEHRQLESLWAQLAPRLAQVQDALQDPEWLVLLEQYSSLVKRHAQGEEQDCLRLAQHILSTAQLRQVARAMQERREPSAGHD